MQLFRAALPGEIQKVIPQHNQTTMTLDDMYRIATTTQRGQGQNDQTHHCGERGHQQPQQV